MIFTLHGSETGSQLIKLLVGLRLVAKKYAFAHKTTLQSQAIIKQRRAEFADGTKEATYLDARMLEAGELKLSIKFEAISIGKFALALGADLDKKAPRTAIFDALCVGLADRCSPEVQEYGDTTIGLISVLNLESSATSSDDIEIQPLSWCCHQALRHSMSSNEQMAKAMHEIANETFNGFFGEYREPPLMERLAGRPV